MSFLSTIVDNWGAWAGAAAAFVLFFDRVAKLTPTTKDDGAVSLAYRLLAILGVKVPDVKGPAAGDG